MNDYAGVYVTANGQSGEIVYCWADANGTDVTLTRTDTNSPLLAKDGHIMRILGCQLFGDGTTRTLIINSKPTGSAGVPITPTITVHAGSVTELFTNTQGMTASREGESITLTTSGFVGVLLQISIEGTSGIVTTTPITPPTPAPTSTVDFDPTVFVYKDAGGNVAGEGDSVYQWNSKIGAYIAQQTITARRPTYRESIFNGKPALEFYLDDILPVTTGSMQNIVNGTNTEFTLFLVVKFYNLASTQIMLGFADNAGANPTYRFGCFLGTNWVAWKTDNAGTSDNLASGAIVNGDAKLLTFVIDNSGSGKCDLYVRSTGDIATAVDTPTATNATYNGGALTATNATFGAVNTNSTNSLFSDAYLGRCIMYNVELSAEQRTSIENELIGLYL